MKDDYLWNKSGEPDPEVQELEEILGVLRYQPKTLVLPDELPKPRRRNHYSLLAIAATIALAILAAGLWFSLKSSKSPASQTAGRTNEAPQSTPPSPSPTSQPIDQQQLVKNNDTHRQTAVAPKHRRHVAANPALIAQRKREREEALAAKQQMLIALRLASEKLNQAQRRIQLPTGTNQIRNQHKVG